MKQKNILYHRHQLRQITRPHTSHQIYSLPAPPSIDSNYSPIRSFLSVHITRKPRSSECNIEPTRNKSFSLYRPTGLLNEVSSLFKSHYTHGHNVNYCTILQCLPYFKEKPSIHMASIIRPTSSYKRRMPPKAWKA